MLRILGKATSINVRKVLWTCVELGIPFVREDKGAELALNPNAMVPVIVDGDLVLWESNTICRYLAGRTDAGAALLPHEPMARAQVELWMDWQATELNNAWRYAFMALVRNSPAHGDPVQVANSIAQWNRHMGMLEGQLKKTGAFAAGPAFSLADVVLGLSANRWLMTPMERLACPAIQAWTELLRQRPGCREWGMNGIA
jgi:glutathione S-transferase